MTRDEAFLQAVLDAPDDDAPRLIYADWLDEHGDADRAEFIRVQCEEAKLGLKDPRAEQLRKRAARLLKSHAAEWDQPVAAALGHRIPRRPGFWERWLQLRRQPVACTLPGLLRSCGPWEYHRGFLNTLEIGMRKFLESAEALFSAAPIREVIFSSGVPEYHARLLVCPFLGRLRSIDLSAHDMDDGDVRTLCENPHLTGLRVLNLQANQIGPDGAGALAASPQLSGLTHLLLGTNLIRDAGALRLAASVHLSRLRLIDVSDCGLSLAGADALRERFPDVRVTF